MGRDSRKKKDLSNLFSDNQGKAKKELQSPQRPSSKGSLQNTPSIKKVIPILILLLISFSVYFNALFGAFVYDDAAQIVDNPWIKDVNNIATIFTKSVSSFQAEPSTSNYYRPLMHIVYMLNYHLFGLRPWGFHLINILIHCGVSALVFIIIQRLLMEHRDSACDAYRSPPFIAAMLFASHPIHTEAVTWVAGLPDVAFSFFYLLSFYLYVLFRDGIKRGYLLSILSFLSATLFKEPALTLPIMLIAYDYFVKKSNQTMLAGVKRYIPYAAVSLVYLAMRYYALRSFAPVGFYVDLSAYQYFINVFPLFRDYLTGLLWPFNLNLWHMFHPIDSVFEAKGVISVIVTAIFVLFTAMAYKRNRILFFSFLLVLIPLIPAFYIRGISGKPFAERYLYLSSVGFVFLPAIFLAWAEEKWQRAVKGIAIALILIWGLYSVATIARNKIWKNDFRLWSDTVKKSPDSPDAHNNLGFEYASQGQLVKAIAEYQTALRLDPSYAYAHYNLGVLYASQNKLDRAITEFQITLRLEPSLTDAHYNLGIVYTLQGHSDKAIAEFQTVLQLRPDFDKARQHLNDILSRPH